MEDPGCPRQRRLAQVIGWIFGLAAPICLADPVAISPRWQVTYPAAANGKACESTAVPVEGVGLLVTVVLRGADVAKPTLRVGNRVIPVQLVGHDPVSRLGFLKIEGAEAPKSMVWLDDVGANAGASLQAMAPAGPQKCRTTGWVKQVGGKILPLALLRVNFDQAVPPPGTPLLDSSGRIVAIVFQEAEANHTGYAIPAEAVHRVRRDVSTGRPLMRGWLGFSLRAETQSPQIVRVLPKSPASAAGIKPADVLLSVGSRQVSDYADAANAFFYLIPGETVRVKLLRGVEPLEFNLTPAKPQPE